MKTRAKQVLFRLLGKDPEAVVVTFITGDPALASAMLDEIRRLVPDRRHFAVSLGPAPWVPDGVTKIELQPGSAWNLYRQLRPRFRSYRIGLAPVLFTADRAPKPLRLAAFLLAPSKILACNSRRERHHLKLRAPIASLLFLRGVPLDRIFLRPRWLCPWKRDRSSESSDFRILEGRPFSPDRKKVAVLSPYSPYPLAHGGAVRIFHLLREMAREFDLILFAFTEEGQPEEYGPVLEFCSRVVLVPKPRYREPRWSSLAPPEVCEYRSAAMRRLWDGMPRELEVAARQIEYTQLAAYGGDILVEHDVTFDLHQQVLSRDRSFSAWWNWWRWRRFERRAVRRFRRVVTMSDKDTGLLGIPHARVVANGVDLKRFDPQAEPDGQGLLFVGSFRHFPNVVAYRFFTEQVWPLLRDRFPLLRLTAVGGPDPLLYWRAATDQLEPVADDRIHLLGFVRDVAPLYVETNLVIVPTLVSAGTNLKVLEAMAMERAVVSTPSGCAGLGLEHGKSVWVAESPADFADGIAALLTDHTLRRNMAIAARRVAEERFDWSRLGQLQCGLISELSGPPISIRAASKADIPDLDRIQKASPEAVLWEPEGYLEYDCRVADLGGHVAGFVVARILVNGEFEVLSLVVDPAVRRRGIGRHLMLHVLNGFPGTCYLEVRESNTPALNLYRKLDFLEIARRPKYYQDTGETAVVMRRHSC